MKSKDPVDGGIIIVSLVVPLSRLFEIIRKHYPHLPPVWEVIAWLIVVIAVFALIKLRKMDESAPELENKTPSAKAQARARVIIIGVVAGAFLAVILSRFITDVGLRTTILDAGLMMVVLCVVLLGQYKLASPLTRSQVALSLLAVLSVPIIFILLIVYYILW